MVVDVVQERDWGTGAGLVSFRSWIPLLQETHGAMQEPGQAASTHG